MEKEQLDMEEKFCSVWKYVILLFILWVFVPEILPWDSNKLNYQMLFLILALLICIICLAIYDIYNYVIRRRKKKMLRKAREKRKREVALRLERADCRERTTHLNYFSAH